MNSKILFTVLAVCFAQLAYCRVAVREVATPPATVSPWVEAFNLANQTLEQFHKSFLSIAGVNSDAELWTKAKDQFKTFETTLRSGADTLNKETEPLQGKAKELFQAFTAKITEVTDDLKAKNPELFSGDAKKLQAVGEQSLRTVVEESKNLRTRLEAAGQEITPKIEATLKQIYESAVQTAQDFKTQAEAAVNTIAKKE